VYVSVCVNIISNFTNKLSHNVQNPSFSLLYENHSQCGYTGVNVEVNYKVCVFFDVYV